MQTGKKNKNNQEEEDANKAALVLYYQEFHKEKNKLVMPKAFVKGGTYDISKKQTDESSKGILYVPSNVQVAKVTEEEKELTSSKYQNAKSYMEELRKINMNIIEHSNTYKDSNLIKENQEIWVKKELSTEQQAEFILNSQQISQGYHFVEEDYDELSICIS